MNSRIRRVVARIGVTAIAGAFASPLMAATDNWDWDYDGIYLGAGVNGTALESSSALNSQINSYFDSLGLTSGGDFSDFPVGGQVYAGWMLNRYLGIEGRYSGTSDGEDDLTISDGIDSARLNMEASLDGWTAYAVGNWPVAQRWDLFAKLGYTWQDIEYTFSSPDGGPGGSPLSASADGDDHGFAAAAGIRWRFARHWAATAEAEYMDLDFDDALDAPTRFSANIEYWFGGAEIPAAAPVATAAVVAAPPPPPPPPPKAPMDSDGDGVPDGSDKCADTPRGDRVGPNGCTCDVSRVLTFAFGSDELTAGDIETLEQMAADLTRLNFISGVVEGHTDSVGSEAYNQGLSERRAQRVADFLQSKGVATGRMQVVGMGEGSPVADNNTAEGRAQNRRVVARRTDCDK